MSCLELLVTALFGEPLTVRKCLIGRVWGTFLGALLLAISVEAGPLIPLTSPTDFFTNVATRLLRSELSLDLNQIQIYPTNQYTPAVHRLLQVTANLYDGTTNRVFGSATNYPYCPSIFRPLFRRIGSATNGVVVIAGYREVTNADLADSLLAPPMIELDPPNPFLGNIPPWGAAFDPSDSNEPLVSGVPLVIAARKGFPNFNELAVQTQVYVSRLLEFRRTGSLSGPVTATNQMYVLGISNNFGLEAWNSYLEAYPRELSLTAALNITAILTNETGAANIVFSNRVGFGAMLTFASNSWNGWSSIPNAPYSMALPFDTTNVFVSLTNSTALDYFPWLEPLTHVFPDATQGAFYVPHWWLNLRFGLVFALVDTAANRIVDYVNLSRWEPTVDLTATLPEGFDPSNLADYFNPANEWITNRIGGGFSADAPTYGVLNQIMNGLNGLSNGGGQPYNLDPYAGSDPETAVDGFRYNLLGWAPLYAKDMGVTFFKSNVFYAPFDPYRQIYIHTSWQANDPLVHYQVSDLLDLGQVASNRVDFMSHIPPLENLGRLNSRYQPWGGNALNAHPDTDYQVAVKDPWITRSDDWDFPTNRTLGLDWIGRVHRGTPWQTIFLKSTNILLEAPDPNLSLLTWEFWTGNNLLRPDGNKDALFTAPTNDWHLASRFNDFFNTANPHQLTSPNQPSLESWEALLDGMTVLTNAAPSQINALTMSSNSPQAAIIAQAILQTHAAVLGQYFQNVGDLLATPELSVASPWLNPGNEATDEALEIIPTQLLPLLRTDSIGTVNSSQQSMQLQFSGVDGYPYALQLSTNLLYWTTLGTNTPADGVIRFVAPAGIPAQFYRTKLLP